MNTRNVAYLLVLVVWLAGRVDAQAQTISEAAPGSTESIEEFAVTRGASTHFVSSTISVLPNTNYIVESSSDLFTWGPASPLLTSTADTLAWDTTECVALRQRFYRLVRRYGSYSSSAPVGRLTRPTADGPFQLTTAGGWTLRISKTAFRMTSPNPVHHYEIWGSTHENFKGKHMKDFLGDRRSFILTDGTLITITLDPTKSPSDANPMGMVTFISIYDGTESHRINMQNLSVDRSSQIALYGEKDEVDGETAQFFVTADGLKVDNVYDQANPCSGASGEKVFNTVPIGRAYDAQPNRTDDYYDDPRLIHT